MATAAKTARRTIAPKPGATTDALPTTSIDDSADIVEQTGGEKITLVQAPAVQERVTVVVPKPYTLTLDDGNVRHFQAGTQEMGVDDAAHWFSRSMGVKVYVPNDAA